MRFSPPCTDFTPSPANSFFPFIIHDFPFTLYPPPSRPDARWRRCDGKDAGDERKGAGTDRLERIVALLLALAGLAERAAGRSAPVRFIVLWTLWQADAVVRNFVAGRDPNIPGEPLSPESMTVCRGYDPADALALAASLRALALIVRAMAAQMSRWPRRHGGQASDEWDRRDDMARDIKTVFRILRDAVLSSPELCDTS